MWINVGISVRNAAESGTSSAGWIVMGSLWESTEEITLGNPLSHSLGNSVGSHIGIPIGSAKDNFYELI